MEVIIIKRIKDFSDEDFNNAIFRDICTPSRILQLEGREIVKAEPCIEYYHRQKPVISGFCLYLKDKKGRLNILSVQLSDALPDENKPLFIELAKMRKEVHTGA